MAKLETIVKQVRHDFSKEELDELATQQAQALLEEEEVKAEAKSVASQYANRLKSIEGKRKIATHKFISKFELREKLCYLRKNYETKLREYIGVDSGKVEYTEPFYPSDHRKQFDLIEEVINAGLGKAKFLAMKFFYAKLHEIATEDENIEKALSEVIQENSFKIISFGANYLVNEKKVLTIEDEVEFDSVFATLEEWFAEFVDSGAKEPNQEDYPEYKDEEIEPPQEDPNAPLDEPQKPQKEKKQRKSKKEKDEEQEEDKKDDEENTGENSDPWT